MMAIVPAEAGSNGEAMPAVDGPIIGRVGNLPVHEAEVAADAPGEAVDTLLRQKILTCPASSWPRTAASLVSRPARRFWSN